MFSTPSPSFAEILSKKSIFKDKSKLSPHYVPDALLFRDAQIAKLMEAVAPALENKKPTNVFVYGKSGSGKTASTKHVMQKLKDEKNERIAIVYMNCRNYDSRYKVLQKIIGDFVPDVSRTGHSFALIYEKLIDWIEAVEPKGKQVIAILDEIDMVKDLDALIYTMTRSNDDLKKGNLSLIGISNKVTFKDKLDTRSKSSLCEEEIVFPSYDAVQLKGILEQRAREAIHSEAADESAIGLAAAIAAQESGDARYALALLLRSGEIAEHQKLTKITEKEVEAARKAADEDKAGELISGLPEHQQYVLYALALISEDTHYKKLIPGEGGSKLYFSGQLYERYSSLCKKYGKEPRTARWYREYIHDLEQQGLLTTVESGKGVRGHATLISPAYSPEKVKKIVEKTLLG